MEGKRSRFLDIEGKKGYIALKRMKKRIFRLIVVLLMQCTISWADYSTFYSDWAALLQSFIDPNTGNMAFQTLLVPQGGRYEGMGTATTALARDSGYIESNPAAGALLRNTELSFSHHNWISDSMLDGITYTVRYDNLGLGLSGKFFYVPFSARESYGIRDSSGYYSESVATLNASYRFLSSYEFFGISAGASLKVGYRNVPEVFALGQSALVIMGDLGAQSSFDFLKFFASRSRNFSLGFALKNLGLSTLANDPLPMIATLGVAYAPARPVTVTLDGSLPLSLDSTAGAEAPYAAIGMNWDIAQFLSLQAGFQLKMNNPRISIGTILDVGAVSFVVNYNLNLAGRIDPFDLFSIQARLNLGDFGRAAMQTKLEEYFWTGVEEYGNGNLQIAIDYWKKVLDIDPTYSPARDYIETARITLELQKSLEAREKR
jgi:hypothetical protein